MLILNHQADYRSPLDQIDAEMLSVAGTREVERFLSFRDGHRPTPLVPLNNLALELGIAAIYVKDEGYRLGLGSFKALGGSYAVISGSSLRKHHAGCAGRFTSVNYKHLLSEPLRKR